MQSTPELPSASQHLQSQTEDDVVTKLLKDNIDVYEELLNHPFPQSLGNGTASLDGFRYYMIQDTFYLETCARIKMLAVARSPSFKEVEIFSKRHESSLKYVKESRKTLVSKLGVPEDVIDDTPRSKNLEQSEKFYKDAVGEDDAYLAYYVVLLPCILSYWQIAERLMKDPSTVKNVIYYTDWIEVNYDSSSTDKYIKFINANLTAKGGSDRWHNIFKTACQLESGIFDTGLQVPKPYQIVPNGTYSIRSSSVALANKSVTLRPPVDKSLKLYFPSTAGSSIVGIEKTGRNNEKWHVAISKNGYTFQNVETGHYIGPATGLNRKDGRILQALTKPYYWWINPVQESPLYQIYESANLRYTLNAATEILKSANRLTRSTDFDHTPIVSGENEQGPYQMWSFELEKPEQLDAGESNKIVQGNNTIDDNKVSELAARYEQMLREEFEDAQQLREKRSEAIRQELLLEAGQDNVSEDTVQRAVELFEKYERVLGEALEAIEQQRRVHNEEKRQEILAEGRSVA
ncbi:hypothetical protein H0H87_005260, partial [Tephrocybe sp. NHM501043]